MSGSSLPGSHSIGQGGPPVVRVSGSPGGGLVSEGVVGGGLVVWVLGSALVLMSGSDSAVPSLADGGGSGGGLAKGVSGSPSAGLSK